MRSRYLLQQLPVKGQGDGQVIHVVPCLAFSYPS